MVPTRGSERTNESDKKKKETPRNPGSSPSSPGSQRHEEKAPGRNPSPTRPAHDPRKDMPAEEEPEGDIERERGGREDR